MHRDKATSYHLKLYKKPDKTKCKCKTENFLEILTEHTPRFKIMQRAARKDKLQQIKTSERKKTSWITG